MSDHTIDPQDAREAAGKRVAILVTDGFEQSEFTSPRDALEKSNIRTVVVSTDRKAVKGWDGDDWGDSFEVDATLDDVTAQEFDALVLPGGVLNPDKLRRSKAAVSFIRDFFDQHKPVAAICHGPQLLIEAEVVKGRKLTSFSSIRKDLENAGAHWVDQEVVVDAGLVTSRSPDDLDAFNAKLIEEVAEGKHADQTA